jgi:hypothetical protein
MMNVPLSSALSRTALRAVQGLVLMIVLLGLGAFRPAAAADPPATWNIAQIHVTYTDTTPLYNHTQLVAAATEIQNYYTQISYGQTLLTVRTIDVSLPHTQEYYFNQCTVPDSRSPCPPPLVQDAADAAAAAGFDFTGIDGISVLSTFCSRDVTFDEITLSGSVKGTFGQSHDFECNNPAPGPSGVAWGGWTHEFGHQLEAAAYGGFNWDSGHPSGYASGYDLMDSCYPCDAGAFSRLGGALVEGSERVFGGWLQGANVVTVSGPPGQTVTLTPLEQNFAKPPGASQAIKVPIASGVYYLVEARTPKLYVDTLQNNGVSPRGIYDTGVKIVKVDEAAVPPETPINACDTTVPKGCVYDSSTDPRAANCTATMRPAYCWPFDLWHVGDTFSDTSTGIKIKVNAQVGNGFEVTVTRGVPPGHPQLYIIPWLTPPMNTYETVDIWVDSSCNGWEMKPATDGAPVVGAKGLLYGRRADGTVIGNGDDPCANHPNRIYANIHNVGTAVANSILVHFQVTNPLGVGVTGSWTEIGTQTVASLAPGATATVFVDWTPTVSLTAAQIKAGAFAFHSCVQVIIDPVAGEIVTSGHQAQENFDNFSAVEAPDKSFPKIIGKFFVSQSEGLAGGFATVYLHTYSALPKGWTQLVNGGRNAVTLGGNTPLVEIPAEIQIPTGSPIGQSYELKVQALAPIELVNAAIPPSSKVPPTHLGMTQVGGVTLSARAVLSAALGLEATADGSGTIQAHGTLIPNEATVITVDFTDGNGQVFTRYARSDAGGKYVCSLPTPPATFAPTDWTVRAFWQGDLGHRGVVSPARSVASIGNPNQPPPPAYARCPGS